MKSIMEEALEEVRRKGTLRVQERLFGKSDPLAELVSSFSKELLAKLRAAEKKYDRKEDWLRSDWQKECTQQLHKHVEKGDPLDVAAYAAFCWYHNWKTNT